jgi:glycosyltransferase involved in cell wall biosynthesis
LLELLQAGRFVVASPVGGIPDIYDGHPEAGLLVDGEDPNRIADTVETALWKVEAGNVDPEAIQERYHQEFDWKRPTPTGRLPFFRNLRYVKRD